MSNKAILEVNGQKHEFPTFTGSENEVAIDISTLRAVTGGVTTIDPGFKNTGSCASEITFWMAKKEFSDIEVIPLKNWLKKRTS